MSGWKSPSLWEYLAIMAGGAIGVGARVWMSSVIGAWFGESFPWGTILVNVLGCFIIGIVWSLAGPDSAFLISPLFRQVVMLGVLGGFTTFSSFSLQTITLLSVGQWPQAVGNVLLSVFACLIATWAGFLAASTLQPKL